MPVPRSARPWLAGWLVFLLPALPVAAADVTVVVEDFLEWDLEIDDFDELPPNFHVELFNLDTGQTATAEANPMRPPGAIGLIQGNDRVGFQNVPAGRYRVRVYGEGQEVYDYVRIQEGVAITFGVNMKDAPWNVTTPGSTDSVDYVAGAAQRYVNEGRAGLAEHHRNQLVSLRDMHNGALQSLEALGDPPPAGAGVWHRDVVRRCDTAIGQIDNALRAGPLNVTVPDADPLIGSWRIVPIPIVNSEECGLVLYNGTITITGKVRDGVYTGTNTFEWDFSGANPDCTFNFPPAGSHRVELLRAGNRITIRYLETGASSFVDDRLQLLNGIMVGVDDAGRNIVYARAP